MPLLGQAALSAGSIPLCIPPSGQRSVTSPMPAHSRTAAMPATAAGLSLNAADSATTVPSGALSRNRNFDFPVNEHFKHSGHVNPPGLRGPLLGIYTAELAGAHSGALVPLLWSNGP